MNIQQNSLVELAYTILGPDGEVVETSEETEPLIFVQGDGEVPEGLEKALEGKQEGDEVEVHFEAGEAFGDFDPDGLVTVPRDQFPEESDVQVDDIVPVTIEDDDGNKEEIEMRVQEISADAVIMDMNPPLAGKAATFKVKVLSVRETE